MSHLGSNDYPWFVLDPKLYFGLDLKNNIVLAFWETKNTYFVPKCYTALILAPKGPYGHRKDCIWTKT